MSNFPIQINETVRVDKGPQVRTAKATKKLLAGGTLAKHYRVGAVDATGGRITLGKKFTYVDYLAPDDEHVYSVYKYDGDRYQLVDRFEDELVAIEAAEEL